MNDAWDDESPDEGSGGYIVCRACGTRIRASREACLRCGQPLEAAPETVSLSTISSGRPLMITLAVATIVLVSVVALWIYRPVPRDDSAKGVAAASRANARGSAAGQPSAGAPRAALPPEPAVAGEPVWFAEKLVLSTEVSPPPEDLQAAKAELEKVTQQNAADADAFNSLGRVLALLGDQANATDRFQRAVALSGDSGLYHFNLGYVLGEQGQWAPAAIEFQRAAHLMPTDAAVQFDLALALHKAGNDAGAVPQYESAIGLAPNAADFHVALAASLERVGQVARAQQELQQFLDMAPAAPNASAVRAHREGLVAGAPTTP